MNLTPEDCKNLIELLNRTTIQGKEIAVVVALAQKLDAISKEGPKGSEKVSPEVVPVKEKKEDKK